MKFWFWYVKCLKITVSTQWNLSPDLVRSGGNPVWQDLFGKFGYPVLSGEETHMPSPVEPYSKVETKISESQNK